MVPLSKHYSCYCFLKKNDFRSSESGSYHLETFYKIMLDGGIRKIYFQFYTVVTEKLQFQVFYLKKLKFVSTTLYFCRDRIDAYATPICDRISLPQIIALSGTSKVQPYPWLAIVVRLGRTMGATARYSWYSPCVSCSFSARIRNLRQHSDHGSQPHPMACLYWHHKTA